MKISPGRLRQNLTVALILTVVGGVMTLLICRICSEEWTYFWKVSSFTVLIWIFLWLGNGNLAHYLDLRISWIDRPGLRFSAGIAAMLVYTVAVVLGLMYIYSNYVELDLGGYKEMLYGSVLITALITTFMTGRDFLSNWKRAALNAEKLRGESIAARYESLRNQVNPHFLFNSLNALTNLIAHDPERATLFVKQLSEVYRYVLDTRDRELVTLSEELKFLDSYLYLQRIRFGDNLRCTVDIGDPAGQVPPLVLQLLIENAIKHNVISAEKPLTVGIRLEQDFLVVENNVQPKSEPGEYNTGAGLNNIRKRYEFLTGKPVGISNSGEVFTVRIPVLSVSQ